MGTYAISGISKALFSLVQARVLSIFFGKPDEAFQLAEIFSRAASGRGAVQRELKKLTDVGIVNIVPAGRRKLYRANRQSPIFDELHRIVLKTAGLADPIREALMPFRERITVAFIYGSIASGSDTATSDIDLMVIGEGLTYSEIFLALQEPEATLARPISQNLMTCDEWTRKLTNKSSFVTRVLIQPKLFIVGTEDDIPGDSQQSR